MTTYKNVQPCSWFTNTCGAAITRNFQAVQCNVWLKEAKVYPNPTENGLVKVDFEGSLKSITINDLLGNVVYVLKETEQRPIELNLSHLPNGVYVLHLATQGDSSTHKIVISK